MENMMAEYIVCPNKRNAPRINVLVCRERCPMNTECPAYAAHAELFAAETTFPVSLNTQQAAVTTAP